MIVVDTNVIVYLMIAGEKTEMAQQWVATSPTSYGATKSAKVRPLR
jgi:predicted nucleic acid-binding protein